MTQPAIYLDNNATTRVYPEAVAAMLPYFTEHYGNASSGHGFGAQAGVGLRKARIAVAGLIDATSEQEIIFTSGGTEANTTAIRSALAVQEGRREIVISAVEHPAVLMLAADLEKTEGITVHRIPVDTLGRLDRAAYAAALSDRVAVVSMLWANNETGTIFPVAQLAAEAHAVGALFHTDAVQVVGKLPISVQDTVIDMLSLSGHKFHGPKGAGALYLRKGVPFRPLFRGGKQERSRRAGTENVPSLVGMGVAAEITAARMEADLSRIATLRDWLEAGLLKLGGVMVLGDPAHRLANTCTVAFDRIDGEAVLTKLARLGIAVSTGSACASGAIEPSHVTRAMAVPFTSAHGVVRFSLSSETTAAEISRVLAVLPEILAELRPVPVADPVTA
ncbi:cysteine desulfurase [Rhodobacter viridis]|uniref:Cysteine desulfurase n=1 Tax=Rhodobacter viridis TaxID=1054202 RepID=A0A318TXE0_9RHOB|nr:aminotransferase class V-fold PLP-dependent enzyme [Rhodobacter viridis]PYF07678.1 cysteine desulfurase [Rhodobacter viridis]